MKFLTLLASIFLVATTATANEVTRYCEKQQSNPVHAELLKALAQKLSYDYNEFCNSPRIIDVFFEDRSVYNRESDTYEDHKFITLHYNEYSCQYTFNLVKKAWGKQHCYNTF